MDKKKIAEFFDRCAPWWDADMIRNEVVIDTILENAGIREGIDVLDVACGTGVLFPDYLKRNVASVTGIDISEEMVKIAASKFPQVQVLCGDVEQAKFDRQFDAVVVYNAFPHFPDPKKLIEVLAGHCKPGGRLTVAHGMSREALTQHHAGRASDVSIDLLHEKELSAIMDRWFQVDVTISNDQMYQVSGVRREMEQEQQLEQMLALMKFMVQHNDAHAQELAALAQQLKDSGKEKACNELMDAVAAFDVANAKLDAVLNKLTEEA